MAKSLAGGRLRGEDLHELDTLACERPGRQPVLHVQHAGQLPLIQDRRTQDRLRSGADDVRIVTVARVASGVVQDHAFGTAADEAHHTVRQLGGAEGCGAVGVDANAADAAFNNDRRLSLLALEEQAATFGTGALQRHPQELLQQCVELDLTGLRALG